MHNIQKICGIKYIEWFVLLWGRWRGYGFWRHFQQYFSYILAVSFFGGGLPGEILLGIQYLLSFLDNCSHWSLLFFMMRITKKHILAYRYMYRTWYPDHFCFIFSIRIYVKRVKKFPEYTVDLTQDKKNLKIEMDRAFHELKQNGFNGIGQERLVMTIS